MNISNEQNTAAGQIVDLIAGGTGATREIHPETAIASCANLAGSLLLRSFKFDLTKHAPGTILLSNEANENFPKLVNILAAFLEKSGITLDKSKLGGAASNGGAEPKLKFLQSLELIQGRAIDIAQRNRLNFEEASISATLATAFIVKECTRNIAPEIGFNVAVYSFIEGSKTVPPQLESKDKPWYKLW